MPSPSQPAIPRHPLWKQMLIALLVGILVTLGLKMSSSMIYALTPAGQEAEQQSDIEALQDLGVENVRASSEDDMYFGDVGNCSFEIEVQYIQEDFAVFHLYSKDGERAIDNFFETVRLNASESVTVAPKFDEECV